MSARDRNPDPYAVLGVDSRASDQEVRAAYLQLVKLHHPDHNGGSVDAARRFEEVQGAYAKVRELRSRAPEGQASRSGATGTRPPRPAPATDPNIEARLAEMERDLRDARLARERARQAAREAAANSAAAKGSRRPTDEELGYIRTDDSFSKILADAREEFSERLAEAPEYPRSKHLRDLIDELEAKLTGESPPPDGRR